jgi:hypothetical protein
LQYRQFIKRSEQGISHPICDIGRFSGDDPNTAASRIEIPESDRSRIEAVDSQGHLTEYEYGDPGPKELDRTAVVTLP